MTDTSMTLSTRAKNRVTKLKEKAETLTGEKFSYTRIINLVMNEYDQDPGKLQRKLNGEVM